MSDILDRRTGDLKALYAVTAREPVFLQVPDLPVIEIAGEGDPNVAPAFADAIQALMSIAWPARMKRKGTDKPVFKVMPLEGIWTMPEGVDFHYDPETMSHLRWRLQLVMPNDFDDAEFETTRAMAAAKKGASPSLADVVFRTEPAHAACSMLHIGPFANEEATFARMQEAITARGLEAELGHREIYLSDSRRTAPEKLKTILRLTLKEQIN